MLPTEAINRIRVLSERGMGSKAIAKSTGISRNTVRSILDRLVLNSHRLLLQGNSMRCRPEYGGLPKNDTEVQRLI